MKFLLWVIIAILAWPVALVIAVGAIIYGLIITGFWMIAFSIKVITAAVVLSQMALTAWTNRHDQLSA